MSNKFIHVAIVNGHTPFRSGLTNLLASFDQINIVFEANDELDLQNKLRANQHVEVILMDINMPELNGFKACIWLKSNFPNIHVLALALIDNEIDIINMLKAGAGGYLLKESKFSEFLVAIQNIAEKGFYLNDFVSPRLLLSHKKSYGKPLYTEKELTFLQFCTTELTYKEIADRMNISPRTVDNYRESLFVKLHTKSRTCLVVNGIRQRLISI